jgi:hypothetical protein
MAKAKTINDVVEAIEALNENLITLTSIEQREERTGGVGGAQRLSILDRITFGGDKLLAALGNLSLSVVTFGMKFLLPLDQMQVANIASGRNLLRVIDELKVQKVGFIGGIEDNAKTQIAAFTHGFDLQDVSLREQLTLLDKAGQQGGQLLEYTNNLVRSGIPRDVAYDMLKNLTKITLTSSQGAESLVKMLSVMNGITPALTELGFGAAPQDVLAELSRNVPGAQAVDMANTFKDIMTANLGGEVGQWALAGGEARSEELKTVLLNIEKTGKITPGQVDKVASILTRYSKDSLKVMTDLGVGLAGYGEDYKAIVGRQLLESNDFADQQTMARHQGTLAGIRARDELGAISLRDADSHFQTVEDSMSVASRSLTHIGNTMRELGIRYVREPGVDIFTKYFGDFYDRLDAVNAEIAREGELTPDMGERYGLHTRNPFELFSLVFGYASDAETSEGEVDEDPVTGTTQEAQLTALQGMHSAMEAMMISGGMAELWWELQGDMYE